MKFFKPIFLLTCFFSISCASTSNSSKAGLTSAAEDAPMEFAFPLTKYKRVSRGYNGKHKGVDVSAPKGTPIYASESGWITYQGRRFKGYGKLVILEHSKNWATFYAHMTKFEHSEGTWVNKGDVVGYVGSTGRSTAPHLHFEVRYKNIAIDPMPYFNAKDLKYAYDDSSLNHAPHDGI